MTKLDTRSRLGSNICYSTNTTKQGGSAREGNIVVFENLLKQFYAITI